MNERHIMCQSRLAVELAISSNLSGGQDKAILDILVQDARDKIGSIDNRDFSIVVRATQDGTVLGGLIAQSRWGGFHIILLALDPKLQGHGTGKQLITIAEEEARRRNCHHIWLDTYEFQAKAFYQKMGFEIFGQIDGPAPVYPRYFMQKKLRNTVSPL
ncbi:GNAT family N-acetyltransferase [Komagataeibacter rhaeticus]|uniref:GNAT family N-acetyltransferase n=1 Tax=Komagataeibacter rhaeticus TaxID=215221 RepID=UPI0004D9CFE2|nr:GNAT family N-acetyltransferase [Komagataeibacter rhaeticus]KDU97514.1 biotin transporter BioY [Komagataeibacter rhaeticus AF1]MBL7239177.1 GNAT family N-acetyltransferase [Komagataeibacter rhaeticus]PYD53810.1 GNAT family N-acetyltransferase [Komagataeibacter rhaeticus]GBQ10207.1 acetyltransferase [Komagataeibacter rhaeticus DSM 16663]